jgi:hypothetical protein
MNNDEVYKAIKDYDPLFYWLQIENGKHYLVPFICQRCGNCCREGFEAPCRYFKEPNTCLEYDERYPMCEAFPVYTDFGAGDTDCPGDKLSREAIALLAQDLKCWIGWEEGDIYKKPAELHRAIDRLRESGLPEDFMDRFIGLNS